MDEEQNVQLNNAEPEQFQEDFGDEGGSVEMPPEKIANFSAGCGICFGAFLGMFPMLISGSFADLLGLVFVFYFGLIVAVEESPKPKGTYPSLQDYEHWAPKYVPCIRGMTGKGLALIFAGCILASFMSANLPSGLIKFMNVCIGGAAVVIGGYGAGMGWSKSGKLNKVREELIASCPGGLPQIKAAIVPYAIQFPAENGVGQCLTMTEFNKFIEEVAKCNALSSDDMVLAFKALRVRRPGLNQEPVPKLTLLDVERWLEQPLRSVLL